MNQQQDILRVPGHLTSFLQVVVDGVAAVQPSALLDHRGVGVPAPRCLLLVLQDSKLLPGGVPPSSENDMTSGDRTSSEGL